MIVWSGWGILTFLIGVLVGGAVSVVAAPAMAGLGPALAGNGPLALGLLAAAAVNWEVGRRLNNRPGREMIDKATGQTVVLRQRHSLFFIRMEWWSVPMAAFAVLALAVALFGSPRNQSRSGIRTELGTQVRPV